MRRAWRGVNGTISGGLLATGPREGQPRCAQHEEQLVRLLRAEFDHRLLSRVVALGHGFGDPRAIRSIWVPTLLTVGENQPAERGRAPLHFGLFRAFLEGVRVSLGRVATDLDAKCTGGE